MWARSSSTYLRIHGLRLRATQICWRLESLGLHVQHKYASTEPPNFAPEKSPHNFSLGICYLSSQAEAGLRNVGRKKEEIEEGFSEESEIELELHTERVGARSVAGSDLTRIILSNPKSVWTVMDKYVSDGNPLYASVISHTMLALRKRHMFQQALQLSKWMEENKAIEFSEANYASQLDLIAKVHGIQNAERYIEMVPKSQRGELLYRTLLANCVFHNKSEKAEKVYNKMRQLSFATSIFTFNQMIILYKKVDKKKIADVLLFMDKENVKANLVTYKHLIDTKGRSGDIAGMEKVIETMGDGAIKPDVSTKAIMAKHYTDAGLKEKANSLLLEIECSISKDVRPFCSILIPLYGSLGKEEEVERLWNVCQPNPRHDEYIAAISAWGKLKQIEKAEAVLDNLVKTKKVASRHYATLLKIYVDNKMLIKGNDLVRRMEESGCLTGPLSWDAVVKLYLALGEVEKADSILEKARMKKKNVIRPMFSSYMSIMEEYAKRGDVRNTEKMFGRLKEDGYGCRLSPFTTLLESYRRSGTPPYGFKERMMAENIFPNRSMMSQLSKFDPFKKIQVSYLFD